MVALIIIILLSLLFLYKRYMPVWGISLLRELTNVINITEDVILLDTRDYITSSKDTRASAYCIPLAYLNRHYVDLPSNKKIVVVASDYIESNLSIRFLRKKGFQVSGYHLTNKFKKEGYYYGVQCANEK